MKLLISIEYRTRWGEQLVMRIGKRRIALQYADGGVWTGAIERYTQSEDTEYRYEIERDGACIRSEWRPHTLRLPAREGVRTLRIRDRWIDMPSDTPFYSSAFTRGIFSRGESGPQQKNGGNITLRVILPTLRPDETLAVAGSGRELGDWKRIVPMDDSRFPEWELTLHTAHRFEYKFLIADRKTLTPILWEEGANRTWGELPGAGEHALDAAAYPRFPCDAYHPAIAGLARDRRGPALPRPGQGTHQHPGCRPILLALPDAPPARGTATQGDFQRVAARHDRLQRALLTGRLRHRRPPAAKIRGTPEFPEHPFYHAAAPSSQVPLRKPSTIIPTRHLSTEVLEGRPRRNALSVIFQRKLSVLCGKFQRNSPLPPEP